MSTKRVAIPFSGGLQREVGAPQAPAGSMENLVDCYIRRGKLTIRRGVAGALKFQDTNSTAITHTLGGQTLRGQRMTLVVGYQGDSNASDFGKVFVYQMDANADVSKRIGTWFTVSDPANDPVPTIVTAESFGRAFFAHDEYRINRRAATQVFDPFTGGQLEDVTADLNNDGTSDPVRFRGVVSHLDYLFGWGYGTVDEDRAEIVRVSRPGAPRQFDPNWYFIPGSRRDPTTAAVPAGGNLLVLKEAETHVIQGSGRDNFGIERIDEHFGCLDPRLAVSVRGTAFFWSSEGPRASQGGVSQSVSNALALKEEDPSGLVAEGNLNDAFAQYIPEEEIVLFQFGQRGYALSIRQESQGWSYWSFDFKPYSAFISHGAGAAVIDGKPADSRPPGNPVFVEAPKSSEPGEVSVEWNNIGEDGDEWVEIWLRSLVPLFEDWRMDTDSDNDGVVDGFTSNTASAASSTFSHDNVTQGSIQEKLQKIALTSDAGVQGTAEVRRDEADVSAGDDVRALVEAWVDNVTDAQGVLRLEFYNASDTLLDSTETTFTDANQELREATFTAPSNTDYVRAICRVEATAADGTADGWFHDLVLHKEGERGSWERDRSVPVETTDPQDATVTGRGAATVYETALRHRRSIFYTSGYDSDNPDNWPVEAKGITAMGADAPTIDKSRWFRDSSDNEGVEVDITLSDDLNQDLNEAADSNKNAFIQLWRDLGQTGSFTRIAEKLPNDWSGTTLTITDEDFAADGSDGEQNADYKATAFVDNEESAFSKTTTQWVGLPEPTEFSGSSTTQTEMELSWVNGIFEIPSDITGTSADTIVEVWTKNITDGDASFSKLDEVSVTTDAGEHQTAAFATPADPGDQLDVKIRHRIDVFGLSDYSQYTAVEAVTINSSGETGIEQPQILPPRNPSLDPSDALGTNYTHAYYNAAFSAVTGVHWVDFRVSASEDMLRRMARQTDEDLPGTAGIVLYDGQGNSYQYNLPTHGGGWTIDDAEYIDRGYLYLPGAHDPVHGDFGGPGGYGDPVEWTPSDTSNSKIDFQVALHLNDTVGPKSEVYSLWIGPPPPQSLSTATGSASGEIDIAWVDSLPKSPEWLHPSHDQPVYIVIYLKNNTAGDTSFTEEERFPISSQAEPGQRERYTIEGKSSGDEYEVKIAYLAREEFPSVVWAESEHVGPSTVNAG